MSAASQTSGQGHPRPIVRHTAEEARREILDHAIEFLWSRPFREMNVAELMAGTTLSRPAFYQYFHDLHHLVETLLTGLEAAIHQEGNPWLGGEGEPRAALWISLDGVARVCRQNGPIMRAVAEAAPMDERLERAWAAFMGGFYDAVAARIEQHQRDGLIAPCDARSVSKALNLMDAAVFIDSFGRRPQGEHGDVLRTLYRVWAGTLYGDTAMPPGIDA